MTLPSVMTYCKIIGRFLLAKTDSIVDLDLFPQGIGLSNARIAFALSQPHLKVHSEPATKFIC